MVSGMVEYRDMHGKWCCTVSSMSTIVDKENQSLTTQVEGEREGGGDLSFDNWKHLEPLLYNVDVP
jgi:hypothetical protein